MTLVDGKPVCVLLASDREVNMKKLASAMGGKSAQMMKPADAERATGYVVGGISPFGQKKPVPVMVDAPALEQAMVFVNGGQRGLQIRLAPKDLVAALRAKTADLSA
jgi:Cys-tRNA(Pro)/Cys-tRNA(Cys) deacylase